MKINLSMMLRQHMARKLYDFYYLNCLQDGRGLAEAQQC